MDPETLVLQSSSGIIPAETGKGRKKLCSSGSWKTNKEKRMR